MTPTQTLTADQQFFFDCACHSYDPRTETPEQGRTRCALDLAAAEAFGRDGSPWGDPYRRVVEAELAGQHLHETMAAAAVA